MLKVAGVLAGVVATCVLSVGIAAANDVEGGDCEYGDASINLYPSCDTSGGVADELSRPIPPVTRTLPPFIDGLGSGVGNSPF